MRARRRSPPPPPSPSLHDNGSFEDMYSTVECIVLLFTTGTLACYKSPSEWLIGMMIHHRGDAVGALHPGTQSDPSTDTTTDITPRFITMCTSSTFQALVVLYPTFTGAEVSPAQQCYAKTRFGWTSAMSSDRRVDSGRRRLDRMKWEGAVISGRKWSSRRGYYTANFLQEGNWHRWR
jgi:hypothetical protein